MTKARIEANLRELEQDARAIARITPVENLAAAVRDADDVIEAVSEDLRAVTHQRHMLGRSSSLSVASCCAARTSPSTRCFSSVGSSRPSRAKSMTHAAMTSRGATALRGISISRQISSKAAAIAFISPGPNTPSRRPGWFAVAISTSSGRHATPVTKASRSDSRIGDLSVRHPTHGRKTSTATPGQLLFLLSSLSDR